VNVSAFLFSPASLIVRRLRARTLDPAVKQQSEFYDQSPSPAEIRAWQLTKFNQVWSVVSKNVPFYEKLLRSGTAPQSFASWDEFRDGMPIIDRATVQSLADELQSRARRADFTRVTGGSTSQPVRLPAWRSELAVGNRDFWFARSWFGITPADKLFTIWGHSHQLGNGFRGRSNAVRREIKDRLLGYNRWSAYDLSVNALRQAGDAMLAFRPGWMLGYSVALDRFARVNADRAAEFRALKLKAVVASAEGFPREDSATRLGEMLGCRVAMEYGSVETGVLAHQRTDGAFQILWRTWFIEGIPALHSPGAYEILLTSLYPRCFPLVRYRIGDLISENPNAPEFNQMFSRVMGRCNDSITLRDGTIIHSEAFTHAVKECSSVQDFQVVQQANGTILFRYISGSRRPEDNEIRRRLGVIHPALRETELTRVATLPQTIAGKTRTIIREETHA
jgi:phenylacetate-CoA ligase